MATQETISAPDLETNTDSTHEVPPISAMTKDSIPKQLMGESILDGDVVSENDRLDDTSLRSIEMFEDDSVIRSHPSYQQVMLDVDRCAGRLEHIRNCYFHRTDNDEDPGEFGDKVKRASVGSEDVSDREMSSDQDELTAEELITRLERDLKYRKRLKAKLTKLIVTLLIRKPELHYYQGFHDVCLTYMTILGAKRALKRLDQIVDSHFSQFMQPTMLETQEFLDLIPIIIGQHDKRVQEFLELAEIGTIFALSWTITWFSHVIPNERDVETIFTFLEKFDDPHVIVYLCASIVLHKKNVLLDLEPEMSTVHHFLCQVPRKENLPIDNLLQVTEQSFKRWPPDVIKKKLDHHRRSKLQIHNYNLVQNLSQRVIPTLASFIGKPSPRAAILVFVLASALAFQWTR